MGVTLTEKAASEVKKIIDKMVEEQGVPEGGELVLRVGSRAAAAAASPTAWASIPRPASKDRVIETTASRLAVEKKFDPYLDGTVVDFYDGLEKRGFVFNNPNVVKSCGCGSSFQV